MQRLTIVQQVGCLCTAMAMLVTGQVAQADVEVLVDFSLDLHDSAGGTGGLNGTADWIGEMAELAASAGVDPFTGAELTAIQADIVSQLTTIYAGYNITFSQTSAGFTAPFDVIYMGEDDDIPFGLLGVAPVDVANLFASTTVNGGAVPNPGTPPPTNVNVVGTPEVAPANFTSSINEFSGAVDRATQLSQIATSLAGTAAHELGHSFGLLHHQPYSDPGIDPSTYGDTGGLQNAYVLATGSTGISETERETLRTFSPWERAVLDVTGGAGAVFGGSSSQSLVTSPIIIDGSEIGALADAGSTTGTAAPITFATGESSGLELSFLIADLDGSIADIDVFSFTVPGPTTLLAEIFSANRFGLAFGVFSGFDAELELLNSVGTVLFTSDNVLYDGDTFNAGTTRSFDPFLVNIPLPSAGTYFLRVSEASELVVDSDVGDAYLLLVGLDVLPTVIPEPASMVLVAMGSLLIGYRRHRVVD